MPAACSFADGEFMAHNIDLSLVNDRLQWDPYPRNLEATQDACWERMSESPTQSTNRELLLRTAMYSAEIYSKLLVEYHEGRIILGSEDPGPNTMNPQYWFARAAFYKAENQRLQQEDYERQSRSKTPEYIYPDFLGESKLDKARGHAQNAALRLASLPEGRAFLAAEDHGESAKEPDYWLNKEEEYRVQYIALSTENPICRARLHAYTVRKQLATFPAGKALLEAEDDGHAISSARSWRSKEQDYRTAYERLKQEFWNHWKQRNTDKGRSLLWNPPASTSNSNGVDITARSQEHYARRSRPRRRDKKEAHRLRAPCTPEAKPKPWARISADRLMSPVSKRKQKRCKRVTAKRSNRDSAYHGVKPLRQPSDPISSRLRSSRRRYEASSEGLAM